jgi:trehalose 6-phosphate phosphatase
MRALASAEGRDAIAALAADHALLAFDFDGTLAPLVPDREGARIPRERRSLLRALALLHPCAVVSGRARADVATRLEGIPLFAIVGSHGAEPGLGPRDRSRREQVVEWRRTLAAELSLVPGIDVEDKWFSVAVHHRLVPSRAGGRALALAAAAALSGARVVAGRGVVNVLPADAPDKGAAVERLSWRAARRPVLYVGDDRSDEDAFRSSAVRVPVRVGRTARSAARWYVPSEGAVDDLLRALIAARTRLDGRGDRSAALARVLDGDAGRWGSAHLPAQRGAGRA